MTVLVLRALGLGDFFTGLPALAMLRQALPAERIVLAVPEAFREFALLSDSVDATVHGHELTPLIDPPQMPELAIDLHGNGQGSRALLEATRPARLIGYGHRGLAWDAGEHEVERWCRLIREGLRAPALPTPSVAGRLPTPPDVTVPVGRTVVHCGAKSASRRWPRVRFVRVAAALRELGHEVVITGGPDEQHLARHIADQAQVATVGPTTLGELVALIAHARLLISGDTGAAHVATNYATPSVILFGPVSPAVWGPPADPRHQVLWHGDGTGNPHGEELDPALSRITEDEVLAAAVRAQTAATVTHGV
jgi:ADP-heptose:LPS heptosyltransferase